MKFQIQENDFEIQNLGPIVKEGEESRQKVHFLYNGQTIERDILISSDEASQEITHEEFYLNNREAITDNLIKFLSENQLYMNK